MEEEVDQSAIEVVFHRLTREGFAEMWGRVFAHHHYRSRKLPAITKAFVGILDDDQPVVFISALWTPSGHPFFRPHGGFYRGSRTVVLPDYQGMGIGVRSTEWLGQLVIDNGYRYYCKTAHPAMGAYRNASPLWRNTGKNMKTRDRKNDYKRGRPGSSELVERFSHEYIGPAGLTGHD
jgi:GNAT superfamily N-acetyltransferase